MNEPELSDAEAAELFGPPARAIKTDDDQLAVYLVLQGMRGDLMEAAEHDKVGNNQLARRLHISNSSVSRFLGGDGDFHVSTAVLYARALGRRWDFSLVPDQGCIASGNHYRSFGAYVGITTTGTMTSGSTQVITAMDSTADWRVQIEPKVKAVA
jgi:hypothetical protein